MTNGCSSGWKFFSSNARTAAFLIVMAVTNPDVSVYEGMSMFLVPSDTPGIDIVRNVGLAGEPEGHGSHALIHYDDVRLPAEALLGGEGQAFAIAQTRLGGGRIHHAMRTIGMATARGSTPCASGRSAARWPADCWPTSSSSRATSPTPTPSSCSSGSTCCTRRG